MRLTGGHAFILCAPPEEQAKLADTFAITAMRSQDEDVLLRIRTHNHPDVITVQPEGATIKIRQARALIEQLSNRAFEGKNRVVCLLQANSMTQEAQNCLLKTLEEPPKNTIFGLFCAQPGFLLETVRSRCVQLRETGQTQYNDREEDVSIAEFFKALSLEQAKQRFPDKKEAALVCLAQWMDIVSRMLHQPARPHPFAKASDTQIAVLSDLITQAYKMVYANVSAKMAAEWLWLKWKEEME